jgi:hypothetical protein
MEKEALVFGYAKASAFCDFFKIRNNMILPASVHYSCKKDANILVKVLKVSNIAQNSANFANTRYFQQ